jgi:hypothetical protein
MKRVSVLICLLIALLVSAPVGAQQYSCGNPFLNENVQFDTSYWELTDFCQHSVPFADILWGGVPPDGIPPIDAPQFESIAAAAEWLPPQSPVIKLEIDGDARAYPLAILTWHEIVNDTVGGVPVVITFCPLCNSALVFERTVGDAELTFGVSGNLRNSDLIMWDRQTQSWWQQFTGEGIVGAYTGTQLTAVPSLVTGFGVFSEQFPQGQVLSRETGYNRRYGQNPYVNYDQTDAPFLFDGTLDTRLPATEHVLAGLVMGEAIAYPFPILQDRVVINDEVGGVPVVALWQAGSTSALGAQVIAEAEDIGWAALYSREVDEQVLTFRLDPDGSIRDDETDTRWNAFGEAIEGALTGARLRLQIAAPHFWFAWAAFQPETRVYGQE